MTGTTLQQPTEKVLKSDYSIPADYVGIFIIGFFLGFYLCYQVASITNKNFKI